MASWLIKNIDVKPCEWSVKFQKSDVFCGYYMDSCTYIETCPFKRKAAKEGQADNPDSNSRQTQAGSADNEKAL
jgi:hypothetical protein